MGRPHPAQKAEARRQAREYARTDDDHDYVVTSADGKARYTVRGINSARVVAGKAGTVERKQDPINEQT